MNTQSIVESPANGGMTSRQLRVLLAELDMNQREAARQIGIHDRTMRRYCAGQRAIPKPVVIAIQLHLAPQVQPDPELEYEVDAEADDPTA